MGPTRYGCANEGVTGSWGGEGRWQREEQRSRFGRGIERKKIDKRDKTTRTNAMVSIDGRREETKPNSMKRRKEEGRVRWLER